MPFGVSSSLAAAEKNLCAADDDERCLCRLRSPSDRTLAGLMEARRIMVAPFFCFYVFPSTAFNLPPGWCSVSPPYWHEVKNADIIVERKSFDLFLSCVSFTFRKITFLELARLFAYHTYNTSGENDVTKDCIGYTMVSLYCCIII